MRIAVMHWAFPPIIGGVESHLAMLCPDLARYGCQVSLLTGSVSREEVDDIWQGIRVQRRVLMDLNSLSPEKIKASRGEIRRLIIGFVQQVHPDLIHVHNMHYFSPAHLDALEEVKERWEIPLVLTAHNVWADELWEEMCRRSYVWDAVIAVSHYIKRELVKAGFAEEKITVIHHGIDTAKFAPPTAEDRQRIREAYPELEGRRVIFHPARMSYDKGCHLSIQALKIIKEQFPEAMLVLAGPEKTVDWGHHQPGHVSRIRSLIADLGLEKDVSIRFFPWEEIPLMYKAADVCVYPSCFEEPFGLVMLESMATGRPIVVSRAGGMPEVVKDGVNGFVVPMHDHRALAEKCCLLLGNAELARRMGENGRQMVLANFNREVMAARTLQVYGQTLARYLRQKKQIA
ncbi:glycosyltransferase family 4 protein [Desulfovirgula thermocuniculi]|uniref:glycosyltransferase family 4 protein n=1 Tax=Desulfovirgula thermocuniculi TaxID=348842 RepID=UPI00047F3524|nr:glycosyltransferase family 4 protein [Desulfovirgula thermocuniculi]